MDRTELLEARSRRDIGRLIWALKDPDSEIRGTAASYLGKLGSSEAGPALVECLDDRLLCASRVGNQTIGRARGRDPFNLANDQLYGRADDDELGRGHTLGQISGGLVDGPNGFCLGESFGTTADADDPLRERTAS